MSEVKSLARGLSILDFVWNAAGPVSIGQLAEHLKIDKSSASRLAGTLVQHGYLDHHRGSRRVIAGRRLVQMSYELDQRLRLARRAEPHLQRLAETAGECAHIAVHDGQCAVVIEDVEARATLRVVGGPGRRIPLHCTAVGKALIVFCGAPRPERLTALTERTICSGDQFAQHLQEVRRLGYAFDDEEHEPGVRCLAAPVYLGDRAIAVIGVSGPTVRFTDDRILPMAQLVLKAAVVLSDEVSAALDCVPQSAS